MARAVFRDAVLLRTCPTGELCPYPRAGCRPGVEDEVPRVAEEYGGNVLYEGAVGDFLVISRSALHAVRYPLSPKLFLLSVISTKYQPVV